MVSRSGQGQLIKLSFNVEGVPMQAEKDSQGEEKEFIRSMLMQRKDGCVIMDQRANLEK